MTATAQFPTSTVSLGQVSEVGDSRALLARNQEAIAARFGLIPVSGSTEFAIVSSAISGSTFNLTLASGCLRTISTHGAVSAAITFVVQTTGASQGQRFVLCKTATGGANSDTVTVDGKAFTANKKFNCELEFVNGAWRLIGWHQYA